MSDSYNKKYIKILLLVHKLSGGGAERTASLLSSSLPLSVQRGIVVFDDDITYPYTGSLHKILTPRVSPYNIIGRIFYALKRLFLLRRVIRQQKPTHIVTFGPAEALIASLIFPRVVAMAQNQYWKSTVALTDKAKVLLGFSRVRKVVAVSQGVKDDLIQHFGISRDKIVVINNPIDIDAILKKSTIPLGPGVFYDWIQNKEPIIITAGRLVHQKGQWHLIRAFAHVLERYHCKLVILGDGPYESQLRSLVERLNIQNNILFLGFQDNPFVYFRHSTMFVSSSLWEGLPVAHLEALACGLPVVSTDCESGPREILDPKTETPGENSFCECGTYGVLVSPLDGVFRTKEPLTPQEEKLREAIEMLLSDATLCSMYHRAGLDRASDFDVSTWIARWSEMFSI